MLHVAYIENDKHSLFTFEQIMIVLRARGVDNSLYVYTSTEEALKNIPLQRPDIIFLDLRINNGRKPSALDLVRTLREHPLCKKTILVAMADYAMPADRSTALAAGCHEFLAKPVRYQSIEETITHLVLEPDPMKAHPPR